MRLALIALALLALPTLARAAIVFDSLELAGGPAAIAGTVGAGGLGFGAKLSFEQDVRISGFAAFNAFSRDGSARFAILSDVPQAAPLHLGDPIAFARDGDSAADSTWKRSAELDFTFEAGRTYVVGLVSNASAITPYLLGSTSAGGITSLELSPNLRFDSAFVPVYLGDGNVQVPIRLYAFEAAAVPEPGSVVMMGIGLIGLASLTIMPRILA